MKRGCYGLEMGLQGRRSYKILEDKKYYYIIMEFLTVKELFEKMENEEFYVDFTN